MGGWFDIVIKILEGGFVLVVIAGLLHRIFRDYFGIERSVDAKIIDKYDTTYYRQTKYSAIPKTNYILVFDMRGKTVKFQVSPIVYEGAEKGQIGILKFKGNKYIDFITNS